MTTTTKKYTPCFHRPMPEQSRTYGYVGYSVRPRNPNPVAHGGVTHHEVCRCGATRMINSTGLGRDERGPWTYPCD